MGFFIIAIVILGMVFILCRLDKTHALWPYVLVSMLILAASAAIVGIYVPTGEPGPMEEVQTIELGPLVYSSASLESDWSTYIVSVVEEEECNNPRMVKYVQKAEPTFWSFGLGDTRKYLVLYLPKDMITNRGDSE